MRIIVTVLAVLTAILGLALSILPFENIALIPIAAAFVLGFTAFKMAQKESRNTKFVKIVFLITIVALVMSIYRAITDENIVENDIETIKKDQQRWKRNIHFYLS